MVIYFDQIFINDICKCFLGDLLCCAVRGVPDFQANYTIVLQQCGTYVTQNTIASNRCFREPVEKYPLLKGQLACAVGMLISCGLYVIVYTFACFGVCFGHE